MATLDVSDLDSSFQFSEIPEENIWNRQTVAFQDFQQEGQYIENLAVKPGLFYIPRLFFEALYGFSRRFVANR